MITARINGFEFDGEFEACRTSMQYYSAAAEGYVQCTGDELRAIFNGLLEDASQTYNCFAFFFENNESGDPTVDCPLVEVPEFSKRYTADGLRPDFGIPRCVRAGATYANYPTDSLSLIFCKREVEEFLGEGFGAYSAERQYEAFMNSLRSDAQQEVDDAVRKFNCFARREQYCF